MAVLVCQRPGSLFLLLLLLHNVQCTSWTPSSRVCCAPGLPESANEVATGSLRYIVIISVSWWRLPETRRCLALAAEDRKSEPRRSVASLCARRGRDKLVRVHYTYYSVARIWDAQIAALSAAQRRGSKLPSIQAWIGPARAWPIVPDRKLNVVYASRPIDKCFGRALQALQASQGAGLETWFMYARLAPRSQCMMSDLSFVSLPDVADHVGPSTLLYLSLGTLTKT